MIDTLISANREIWTDSVSIHLAEKRDGRLFVAAPPVLSEMEEGLYSEPFLRLSPTAAQRLVDELWNCGYRPSSGTGSAGSLAATEKHLKDMQAIAKGLLRKDGVSLD